jgi:hypothetical protein
LNGKLVLYPKKDATEQLRRRDNVSLRITAREIHDDILVVTARAWTTSGREDESTGAVSLVGLKGEARANAVMKAETKAKRRVTLSICGLGWVDESELETIPSASHVPVDLETGEIVPLHQQITRSLPAARPELQGEPVPSALRDSLLETLREMSEEGQETIRTLMKTEGMPPLRGPRSADLRMHHVDQVTGWMDDWVAQHPFSDLGQQDSPEGEEPFE